MAAAWLAVLLLASLTAPLWEPYPVDQQDPMHTLLGPPASHWLGTDDLGRDLLTRIAAGSWISVGPALLSVYGVSLRLDVRGA